MTTVKHAIKEEPPQEEPKSNTVNSMVLPKSTIREVEPVESQRQPEPSPRIICDDAEGSKAPSFKQCEDKDRPVRLFVGQVPETMVEPHIVALFNSKNIKLLDAAVIRDKHTGRHRHCAFITVPNREAADLSIEEFHNRKYLETMANPMQVREANQPKSKAAYAKLKEYSRIIGTAMPVFADSDKEHVSKESLSKMYSYRMTPPGLHQQVMPLNPFFSTPYFQQVPPPFVYGYFPNPMAQPYLNMQSYPQTFEQKSAEKTSTPSDQKRGAEAVNGNVNDMFCLSTPSYHNTTYGAYADDKAYSSYASPSGTVYFTPSGEPYSYYNTQAYQKLNYSEGPPGANLFVNNLPEGFSDEQLLKIFAPHGSILSCKVFIDKHTHQSKGFGFVSFGSVEEAQEAIREKNGFKLDDKRCILVELKRPRRYRTPECVS